MIEAKINQRARGLNAVLGLWLAASAFLWPHGRAEHYDALFTGLAVLALAVAGLAGVRWTRWGNAALAIWLLCSTIGLPYVMGATVLNHAFVGLLVLIVSFFPPPASTTTAGGGAGTIPEV